MKNEIFLDEFYYECDDVLDEKLPKYLESWKTAPFSELRGKMLKQMEKLVLGKKFTELTYIEKEKMRRATIHIANYCFFLYNKLGE